MRSSGEHRGASWRVQMVRAFDITEEPGPSSLVKGSVWWQVDGEQMAGTERSEGCQGWGQGGQGLERTGSLNPARTC